VLLSNRYHLDLRIFNLAVRMLGHGARTGNICNFTGLSDDRVRKLEKIRGREGLPLAKRDRGPTPSAPSERLDSASLRSEAAALTGLCRFFGVFPPTGMKNARKRIPSLERGEALVAALDLFQFLVPNGRITLDELLLLVANVAEGGGWAFWCCPECGSQCLIDTLARRRSKRCEACQADEMRQRQLQKQMAQKPTVPEALDLAGLQLPLFEPDE
jgi:hypothetical protein